MERKLIVRVLALCFLCFTLGACMGGVFISEDAVVMKQNLTDTVALYNQIKSDIRAAREAGKITDNEWRRLVTIDKEVAYIYNNLSVLPRKKDKMESLVVILAGALDFARPVIERSIEDDATKTLFNVLSYSLQVRRSRILKRLNGSGFSGISLETTDKNPIH